MKKQGIQLANVQVSGLNIRKSNDSAALLKGIGKAESWIVGMTAELVAYLKAQGHTECPETEKGKSNDKRKAAETALLELVPYWNSFTNPKNKTFKVNTARLDKECPLYYEAKGIFAVLKAWAADVRPKVEKTETETPEQAEAAEAAEAVDTLEKVASDLATLSTRAQKLGASAETIQKMKDIIGALNS